MARIKGTAKRDTLKGGKQGDTIIGLSGDDRLDGGNGRNKLKGGGGNDLFVAGTGKDAFGGGGGIDTVDYGNALAGIVVSLLTRKGSGGAESDTFKKIENIEGSAFADTIVGDGKVNRLRGLDGDDHLSGGGGNDTLDGGNGNDRIEGGAGGDALAGGAGFDTLVYENEAAGVIVNLATGSGGGAAAGDTFSGFETVAGSAFHDTIIGTGVGETLLGGGGNDVIDAGQGDDTVRGGAGNDTVHGGAGVDTIRGGDGNDVLDGGPGKDAVYGDGGDDRLTVGGGTYDGGAGVDTLDFTKASQYAEVNLAIGKGLPGLYGADIYLGIENVDGSNAGFGDYIIGNDGMNVLRGFAGDDRLFGEGGHDRLEGGLGHDDLEGEAGNDHLIGGAGNDVLDGGAGGDILDGGDGFDAAAYRNEASGVAVNLSTGTAGGAAAGDTFSGIEGIYGTAFGDTITGDGVRNVFYGFEGTDTLSGGGGDDVLAGGDGFDTLVGGEGNDILYAGELVLSVDALNGGTGDDWVDYSDADAGVVVNLAQNSAGGAAQGDVYLNIENVKGSLFDDELHAAGGGRAYGGKGQDTVLDAKDPTKTEVLRGGLGTDTLDDAAGGDDGVRDIFFVEPDRGLDTVKGFDQGTDLFWLSEADAYGNFVFGDLAHHASGQLAAGRVVNDGDLNGKANATQAYAQLVYETDTKLLWYDKDGTGSGAAVQVAKIDGFSGTLKISDFLVVPDV